MDKYIQSRVYKVLVQYIYMNLIAFALRVMHGFQRKMTIEQLTIIDLLHAACHFCNPYVPFLAVTEFERFIHSDLWEGGS